MGTAGARGAMAEHGWPRRQGWIGKDLETLWGVWPQPKQQGEASDTVWGQRLPMFAFLQRPFWPPSGVCMGPGASAPELERLSDVRARGSWGPEMVVDIGAEQPLGSQAEILSFFLVPGFPWSIFFASLP